MASTKEDLDFILDQLSGLDPAAVSSEHAAQVPGVAQVVKVDLQAHIWFLPLNNYISGMMECIKKGRFVQVSGKQAFYGCGLKEDDLHGYLRRNEIIRMERNPKADREELLRRKNVQKSCTELPKKPIQKTDIHHQ